MTEVVFHGNPNYQYRFMQFAPIRNYLSELPSVIIFSCSKTKVSIKKACSNSSPPQPPIDKVSLPHKSILFLHHYHYFDAEYHSHVKIRGLNCSSLGESFVCEARRNPESFSRQNKQGFSRSRNWLNEGRDNFENLEEDMLSSKNGPLISLPSTSKSQANAAPGPREKEIVALFRKVQARLRERAAIKEEKKVEASQGQRKENSNVDSLLKLLRKHSVEQGKRSSGGGRERKSRSDQLQDSNQYNDSQSTKFSDSDSTPNNESQKPNISFIARPPSSFQKRSPAPRLKYQPVSYNDNDVNAVPLSSGVREKGQDQIGLKHDTEPEPDTELELDPKDDLYFPELGIVDVSDDESHDSEQIYNEEHEKDQQEDQHEDLSSLKLTELRGLAKSRGLKGFSKMKKGELMKLLTGS